MAPGFVGVAADAHDGQLRIVRAKLRNPFDGTGRARIEEQESATGDEPTSGSLPSTTASWPRCSTTARSRSSSWWVSSRIRIVATCESCAPVE